MTAQKSESIRPNARRIGAVAVASGLLLAALTGTAGAKGPSAADKAQAKKALLVLADLPKGWKSAKSSSGGGGNNSFPDAAQLASCIGVPSKLIAANPPEVDSPEFDSKDQSLEVDDSVTIFPSVKNANASYAAIANAKTPDCMANLMNGPLKSQIASSAGKGTTVGTITVTKTSSPHGTSAFTVGLPIKTQGISVTAKLTILTFVKGKLGQQISFDAYGPTFPASLVKHLTSVATGRL